MNGYNNTGVSDNTATNTANYDGQHYSYSAQALQAAGITPGSTITSNGFAFTWPDITSGLANNYRSKGQTIAVTPVNHAQSLALLGSATDGAASGTATITYTDGTVQTFTLSFTDWAWSAPHFGNTVVVTMPYRNARYGRQSMAVHLFATSIALQPGKTVQSVTLPTSVGGRSSLHVFAITTK